MDDTSDVRSRSEDSARRLAAAISGAIEGFVEGLEEHDLAGEAQAGIQTAGEVVREAAPEARAQAQTPELREAGQAIAAAASRTAEGARETMHAAREKVEHARENVKAGAQAVSETGRRARRAPGLIATDLKKAAGAWWKGLVVAATMIGVIAVFAIVTLVVLTIALVVGFNRWLGDPAGTFLVAGLYVVLMLAAWGVARSRRTKARAETARRIEDAKQDARHVVQPLRSTLGGGGARGGV